MSAQPEALRIADECEQSAAEWRNEVDTRMQAAAELRRLHAENEAKDALLRQALELLEDNREDVARVETTYMHKCYDPVLHAIKRHLENGS